MISTMTRLLSLSTAMMIAMSAVASAEPSQELIDAAFWLQLQAAGDFAGGRVVLDLEVEP